MAGSREEDLKRAQAYLNEVMKKTLMLMLSIQQTVRGYDGIKELEESVNQVRAFAQCCQSDILNYLEQFEKGADDAADN